ncbi:MAG: hypothetical protein IJY66_06760, partial [Clostridia bacterium]|nr:hypothetical protein [Clostridia bacterium]
DLNMFEQAEAFRRLIDEFMLTQEEVARRVSLSQSAVANKLRILRLSREERQEILQAGLTERHARALLKISEESLRWQVLQHIIEQKLNVSHAEAYIDEILDQICRKSNSTPHETRIPQSVSPLSQEAGTPALKKGAIREIQLFYNSIKNAARILEQTGLQVCIEQSHEEGNSTFIIRLIHPDAILKRFT